LAPFLAAILLAHSLAATFLEHRETTKAELEQHSIPGPKWHAQKKSRYLTEKVSPMNCRYRRTSTSLPAVLDLCFFFTPFCYGFPCLSITVLILSLTWSVTAFLLTRPLRTLFHFSLFDAQTGIVYGNIATPSHVRKPTYLVIYPFCHERDGFSVFGTSIPSIGILCNNVTNPYDCHEAVPYLNFVIDNYDSNLADKYIFVHGHDRAWHYQGSVLTAIGTLINTRYFRNQNFGGLFKAEYAGGACGEGESGWAGPLYRFLFANTSMPTQMVTESNQRPCCGTFWMNSELVRTRPKEEYVLIRDRLREWSKENMDRTPSAAWFCGRMMEYNWHILFANTSYISKCWFCQGDFY
jgi:hypothetical protein